METVERKLSELKPYPKNAKKHPPEQVNIVAQSIKEFGWAQPIVIDENDEILIGHGRLKAGKLLKLETAPCLVLKGLTEEQKKKLRLIDNKSNESEWDIELLKEELNDLDFSDFPDVDWGIIEKPEKEDEQIEVNPIETLPESRVLVCSVSAFGVKSEVFMEFILQEEEALKVINKFKESDACFIVSKLRGAINEL